MNQMELFFTKYELLNSHNMPWIVGLGVNSAVQLAKNKKTQKMVAVKKIFRKQAFKQASIHSMLRHPNIVQFIEFFNDQETNSSFIVLQYISNGTLSDLINIGSQLNSQALCKIFLDLTRGLQAIHKSQIIHGDIKPANIIFDQDWNGKICDFGSAIESQKSDYVCGTFEYMAPQVLRQKQFSFEVDVWALGIIMYEVLEGKLPFNKKNKKDQLEKMQQPLHFDENTPKKFAEIIRKMLCFNPLERPSITQVIHLLQKMQKSSFKQQKNYQTIDDKKEIQQKIQQSQNSTIDSKDQEQKDLKLIKQNIKQKKLHKVISLKYFRLLNQNQISPKIIISKPIIKKKIENICFNCISPITNKISIKQLIDRKNF